MQQLLRRQSEVKGRQDSLGFMLADVARLMRRDFKLRLEGSCLTHAQARVLVHTSRHEGIRQVELAEMLEVQPITLARLLDQLAEVGLIERRPDPRDRRAHHVYLTAAAAPHLASIERVAKTIYKSAMRDLTEKQAAAALAALRKMRDNLASE
jgi:DNA-binding MarR family transcriptional regulator